MAYFLDREHQIRLSVPKSYEILAEKYVIRSKWRKNQKRRDVPIASGTRAVIPMDTVAFGLVFTFTGIDIYTKEAEVVLRPAPSTQEDELSDIIGEYCGALTISQTVCHSDRSRAETRRALCLRSL